MTRLGYSAFGLGAVMSIAWILAAAPNEGQSVFAVEGAEP
jgi:hypothetical protein